MHDKEVILRRVNKDRIPHYHQNFPLILFGAKKVDVLDLQIGFSFKLAYLNKQCNIIRGFIRMNMKNI